MVGVPLRLVSMPTQVGQILYRASARRRRTGGGSSSSPCIQTEPSSNVMHRTCRPSSTVIFREPHTGLSLREPETCLVRDILRTPASEKIVVGLAHSLITACGAGACDHGRVSE